MVEFINWLQSVPLECWVITGLILLRVGAYCECLKARDADRYPGIQNSPWR